MNQSVEVLRSVVEKLRIMLEEPDLAARIEMRYPILHELEVEWLRDGADEEDESHSLARLLHTYLLFVRFPSQFYANEPLKRFIEVIEQFLQGVIDLPRVREICVRELHLSIWPPPTPAEIKEAAELKASQ